MNIDAVRALSTDIRSTLDKLKYDLAVEGDYASRTIEALTTLSVSAERLEAQLEQLRSLQLRQLCENNGGPALRLISTSQSPKAQ